MINHSLLNRQIIVHHQYSLFESSSITHSTSSIIINHHQYLIVIVLIVHQSSNINNSFAKHLGIQSPKFTKNIAKNTEDEGCSRLSPKLAEGPRGAEPTKKKVGLQWQLVTMVTMVWEFHGILCLDLTRSNASHFRKRGWQGLDNATIWRRWLGREFLETSPVRGGRRPAVHWSVGTVSLPVDTSTEKIEHPWIFNI